MQYWIFSTISLIVTFLAFNKFAPIQIHDELHHVLQLQQYLRGNFRFWNPMITTPPALYIFSLPFLWPLKRKEMVFIRMINLLFSLAIIALDPTRSWIIPFISILFPYTLLYYTDAGGLFFVLLAQKLFTMGSPNLSALAFFVSVAFRQTNIVWCAKCLLEGIVRRNSIMELIPFAAVIVCFLAFMYWNKGVVLGDRSSHGARPNVPQFFYCIFTTFMIILPSINLEKAFCDFYRDCLDNRLLYLSLLILHVYSMKTFSFEHSYMKLDKTHLTTVIWQFTINKSDILKYGFIPLLIFAENVLTKRLISSAGILQTTLLAASTAMVTIPSPLIEPRYYIVPVAMYLMQSDPLVLKKVFPFLIVVDLGMLALMCSKIHAIW